MDLNLCIFASLLLTVGAARFDLGPQKFEEAFPSQFERQNSLTDEVVVYLTPGQIKALEDGGAVVRPADSEESAKPTEADDNAYTGYRVQQEEYDNEEGPQYGNPNNENVKEPNEETFNENVDLNEILRIINEEQFSEREQQNSDESVINEPQVEEPDVEEPREIPLRFSARQKLQEQKQRTIITPSEKKARTKLFSSIRYQPAQKPRVSLSQVQEPTESEEQSQEESQESIPVPVQRFRLVPYDIEENDEELRKQSEEQEELEQEDSNDQSEEDATERTKGALLKPIPKKLSKVTNQRRSKLYQDELALQAALRELKQSAKNSEQRYATDIEKLRAHIEKQNKQTEVDTIARLVPQLIKKEIEKRKPSSKQVKESTQNPEKTNAKIRTPVPVLVTKPIAVAKKVELERPVKDEKRVPVTRNIYVKGNKPYLVEHVIPVDIKKNPTDYSVRKNEKITILRHTWEQ